MPNEILLLLSFLAGLLVGLTLWWLQSKQWKNLLTLQKIEQDKLLQERREQFERLSRDYMTLNQDSVGNKQRVVELETLLQEKQTQFSEKLKWLQETKQSLLKDFREVATHIVDEKSSSLRELNQQSLQLLLQPLSLRIQEFEKRVSDVYENEARERFSLSKEIQQLNSLNLRLSQEATNLTQALKGQVKKQGIWGELILERLLEQSGLERGREYAVQTSLQDEHGQRFQPDAIIYLPENRQVIIDAKVSLIAFERYHTAEAEEDKAAYLKQHLLSLRNHVRQLSEKKYQELPGITTLDFVLLFIPIESAFQLLLKEDPELLTNAMHQKILLVGPTTLLVTLRTIQYVWRVENQNRHAEEIARLAGGLLDKLIAFISDLDEIGLKLSATQKAFEAAQNKLVSGKGNLIKRAETIRKLGARATKEFPESLLNSMEE